MMILQRLYTRRPPSGRGFTLVELAIVLAVASLLFAGLWRLMSAGSTQLQDQAVADQQKQLGSAVQAYLSSTEGQLFIAAQGPNQNVALGLPNGPWANNAACRAAQVDTVPTTDGLCDFLPNGFNNATTNSYGQTYAIQVQKDGQLINVAARNYSFMILTNGGAAIPDSSGGRIASMIGNDGGFVYAINVCGAPAANWACGAFGSWAAQTTGVSPGYGFGASNSGSVASRTAVSVGATNNDPWLARRNIGGGNVGVPATRDFNTVQTDTWFSGQAALGYNTAGANDLYLGNNTIFGGSDAATTGGEIMNLHFLSMGLPIVGAGAPDIGNTLTVSSPCRRVDQNDVVCTAALQINGDANVTGLLSAVRLFAGSFIYWVPSDIRLKHDVRAINHPLDKLSQIRGVAFRMNSDGEEKLGVVAQEVEKVYPELVHDIGGGKKGVDYIGLIGPLVAAVNELKAQNEALTVQVKSQAEEIKQLKDTAH